MNGCSHERGRIWSRPLQPIVRCAVKDAEEQFYPRLPGESLPECYARTEPGEGWILIRCVPGQPGVLTAAEWAWLEGPKQ